MKKNSLNRRDFIGMTVAGSGALFTQSINYVSAKQFIRVRKNINTLSPDSMEIQIFKRVIRIMTGKEKVNGYYLPETNYRHWYKQAEIHKNYCDSKIPNKQVHQSWLFLPWHRAYLNSFELIARTLPGCENFTLPYWDWTSSPKIPGVFSEKDLDSVPPPSSWNMGANFVHERRPKPNAPIPISAFRAMFEKRVIDQIIKNPMKSFYGVVGREKSGAQLESGAHSYIHTDFVLGNMGEPLTAALDPIFWLHHANIDRLWLNWMRNNPDKCPPPQCQSGEANTNCCSQNEDICRWLDINVEEFYDVSGNRIKPKICTLLDTYRLGYRYDDSPLTSFTIGNCTKIQKLNLPDFSIKQNFDVVKKVKVNQSLTIKLCESCIIPNNLKKAVNDINLNKSLKSISPKKLTKQTTQIKPASTELPSIFLLTIELEKPANPQISVRVFITIPTSVKENPATLTVDSPSYIATIGFFESTSEMHHHGNGATDKEIRRFIFDVTDKVQNMDQFNLETATVIINPVIFQGTSDNISGEINLLGFKFEVAK